MVVLSCLRKGGGSPAKHRLIPLSEHQGFEVLFKLLRIFENFTDCRKYSSECKFLSFFSPNSGVVVARLRFERLGSVGLGW